MEKVIPRTVGQESMTQGQEVKQPVFMRTADNAEGNESGVSTTAGLGAVAVQPEYSIRDVNIRNFTPDYLQTDPEDYSHENRSAKWKNGEGGTKFDPGQYGNNQYQ